ncbi:hypothetical protein KKB99_04565 [bacterium]|nr:hypothetical protein [bacterium]MBU1025268.1 hypothetical protein [bacterium]
MYGTKIVIYFVIVRNIKSIFQSCNQMNLEPIHILTSVALIIVALFIFKVIVRHDYLNKGRLTPFSTFLELIVFFLHASSSYLYLDFDFSHVNRDFPIYPVAILFMVIGMSLLFINMAKLSLVVSFGSRNTGLQKSGMYRCTRNPQIVTYLLFLIGYLMLWTPSWTALVWLVTLVVMAHRMVLTEEEHLLLAYGDEYRKYCSKTPRYPGLRVKGSL